MICPDCNGSFNRPHFSGKTLRCPLCAAYLTYAGSPNLGKWLRQDGAGHVKEPTDD